METSYELVAPYWKAGSDCSSHLSSSKTTRQALVSWAKHLESSAKNLRKLAKIVTGTDVKIDQADTHFVSLTGNEAALQKAVKAGLVRIVNFEE